MTEFDCLSLSCPGIKVNKHETLAAGPPPRFFTKNKKRTKHAIWFFFISDMHILIFSIMTSDVIAVLDVKIVW